MGEEALIRREALLAVLNARGLKEMHAQVAFLSSLQIARDTYWRDLLKGNKSFGEKMARKIEAALQPALPRGYLDVPPDRAGRIDMLYSLRDGSAVAVEVKEPPPEPPRPDSRFSDVRTPPTDSEWAILDAIRAFPQEERDRVRAELTEKAGYWERIAKELLKQRTGG